MKKFLLLFIIIDMCAGFSLSDLKNQMHVSDLRGSFKQEKILQGFQKPIKSYGKFFIGKNELIWDMQKPIKNTIKINPDGIFLKYNNQWIQSQGFYDKKLFLQIIQMDIDGLEKNFQITLEGNANNWSLELEPKGILKKIFSKIEIDGGIYVKKITLTETNGDITTNYFYEVLQK